MQKKNWVIFFITGMIVFISYFIGMAIYDHTSFLKTAWPMPVVAAIIVSPKSRQFSEKNCV